MSSTSRSADGKPVAEEPEKKKGSAGRYSLSDEADQVPPTRIDSTTRMPAVRPEISGSVATTNANAKASSVPKEPQKDAPKDAPKDAALKKKSPIGLPTKPAALPKPPTSDVKAKEAPPPLPLSSRTLERDGPPSLPKPHSSKPPKRPSMMPAAMGQGGHGGQAAPRRISSLRPPPTSKGPSASPPSLLTEEDLGPELFASFDELDEGSIAFAFDALVSEGTGGEPGKHEFDYGPVRELFAELAANHMRHVRDFMIDVKWGEVARDWIQICLPPVRTLRRAAERLDLGELCEALEKLGTVLDETNSAGGHMLDAAEKERLLESYGALVTILPQAFALDRDKTQREAVIVQALLLQVPDVRKVTIDKLHAAGLTSLSVLYDANANDIAHVADIPHQLASRIVERVQAYRTELQSSSPSDARAAEREKLAALNGELKTAHEAYEEAAHNTWTPDSKQRKRESFKAREEAWLAISVLLARFGEVDRLQGIEKVPFAVRITQLGDFLEEAREKYRAE